MYRPLTRITVKNLAKAKLDYLKTKFEACNGNLRATWKNIKYPINCCKTNHLSKINHKNQNLHTSVSDATADHFATIADTL